MQPRRVPIARWYGEPKAERFAVRADDGTTLRGWIIGGASHRARWVLLCYGNIGTAASMLGLARWFVRRTGSTAVVWDYRGFGFSDGTPSIAATMRDALTVYDAMRARSGRAPIVYGLSFGTTIATHIAAQRTVAALILRAPPSSAEHVVVAFRDRHLPWFLHRVRPVFSAAVREDFDLEDEVRRIQAPTVVLHGTADELIPIDEGRAVEAASAAPMKRFIAIPRAGHSDVDYDTPGGAQLAAFLRAI